MLYDRVPAARLSPPAPPRPQAWINKTGSTNGFAAYVAFIPGQNLGIALLANQSYPIADRVMAAYRILSALAAPAHRGGPDGSSRNTGSGSQLRRAHHSLVIPGAVSGRAANGILDLPLE